MFIRFFKDNNPSLFFLLPILTLSCWFVSFFKGAPVIVKHPTFLYSLLVNSIQNVPFLNILLAFILIIIGGLVLNMMASENEIMSRYSFLPALFYVLFLSHTESLLSLHPLLISNIFTILGLNQLMSSYRKTTAFSNIFNAGFFFALASVFYFPCILLFPMLSIGLIIFRPYIWREWIISFLGFTTPYYFLFTYLFWNNKLYSYFTDIVSYFVLHEKPVMDFTYIYFFIICLGAVIILISTLDVLKTLTMGSLKNKKSLQILLWSIVFGVFTLFLTPEWKFMYFTILTIPAAVFVAKYFIKMKKQLLGEIAVFIFVLLILINNLSALF